MKVLLHMCCAPCSVTCLDTLEQDGHETTGLWFNPNIHPFTEYRARRDALRGYAGERGLPMLWTGEYGLRPFLERLEGRAEGRCGSCYRVRLDETARVAAEGGFEGFTTTLLVSPYQNRDLLLAVGEEAAARVGIPFLPYDFRPRFREGQQAARTAGLYMQKYCGCIFSEEERYCR